MNPLMNRRRTGPSLALMAGATTKASSKSFPSPLFERAVVADAMTPEVITCPADAPLRWVAGVMSAERIHCVVIDPDDRPGSWRIVSDLDLMRASGEGLDAATAGGVAATELLTVTPDEQLGRAAQLMAEHDITHLVVVDTLSRRPIGVLSTLDVANVLTHVAVAV
jgi:CBS domain-containing protein